VKIIYRIFAFILIFITYSSQLHAQTDSLILSRKDLVDVLRGAFGKDPFTHSQESERDSTKLSFSVIPSFAVNGSEKGVVTSFNAAFFLGPRQTTNLSNIYFTPYFTFSEQYVVPIRSYIWTANNKFNLIGDYRFMKYPQLLYSMYDHLKDKSESRLDYYQTRFYQTLSRRIFPNAAAGLGLMYDYYSSIEEDQIFTDEITSYQRYGDTNYSAYASGGLSFELIWDTRRNTLNPKKGEYLRLSLRNNVPWLGSKALWSSLYIDFRKYFLLNPKHRQVLGFWGWYWSILDGKPNYLDLPSIGWDYYGKTGRGTYRNRYRSSTILYLEAEYRTELTDNGLWGMVAFANMVSPTELFTYKFQQPSIAIGSGVRLRLNKRTASNIGFDVGVSRAYWTYYLTLNEFF
jgi:hypothetical protein